MPLKPQSKPLKSHNSTIDLNELRRDFPIDGSIKFAKIIELLKTDADEAVKSINARPREKILLWFMERLYPNDYVRNKPAETCRNIYSKYPLSAAKFAKELKLELGLKTPTSPAISDTAVKLQKLIDCNAPIICIQNHDTARVDAIIQEACGSQVEIEWTPGIGAIKFATKMKHEGYCQNTCSEMLSKILEERKGIFVLRDIDLCFNIAMPEYQHVVSALHLMAQRKLYDHAKGSVSGYEVTLIIVSSRVLPIPAELKPYVSYLELPPPSSEEIEKIIEHHLDVNNIDKKTSLFKADAPRRDKIKESLKGLSAFDIDRILDKIISENGKLTDAETAIVDEQKRLAIKNSGHLELIDTDVDINSVGGLDHLKSYLQRKGQIMCRLDEARKKYGCSMPKGIMLVGMPGCGKSMIAKAAAKFFNNTPLLRMDIGKLQGKYVGESEQNMREAIRATEDAAPCILWIDEVEKAFAGTDSGHEAYTTRMFGFFLTWLQDRKSHVYVIATANKFHMLPPEFRRKGRFDEIFFLDLPKPDERKAIFDAQMNAGNRHLGLLKDYPPEKVEQLIKATEDCNGADINAIIDASTEKMFLDNTDIHDRNKVIETMLDTAHQTIGINQSCRNELEKLKEEISKNFLLDATTGKKIEPQKKK